MPSYCNKTPLSHHLLDHSRLTGIFGAETRASRTLPSRGPECDAMNPRNVIPEMIETLQL